MLLVVVVAFVAIMTLGGLGNAAYSINSFYWVPFVIDIPFFVYVCYKLVKAGDITAKPSSGSGAAHPAPGENVKEDTVVEGKQRDPKAGRYMKAKEDKTK